MRANSRRKLTPQTRAPNVTRQAVAITTETSYRRNMATHALTAKELDTTIDQNPILLIDWWAEWCGPCKAFGPVFERASETHPDIHFAKVDTEAEQELAGQFQIRSIPTLMAFRDGILVFAQAGALPGAALEELITKVKSLDMDEVRRAVEEQEKNAPSAAEFESEE